MVLKRLSGLVRRGGRERSRRLYAAAVQAARDRTWYYDLGIPDSVDGRFDMLALHLFLLQNRLGDAPGGETVMQEVLELFVADMDQNLRELGIGDPSMGREVRGMVEALGGRFEAYATGLDDPKPGGLTMALARNVFRDAGTSGPALESLADYVRAAAARLSETPLTALLEGTIPPLSPADRTGTNS